MRSLLRLYLTFRHPRNFLIVLVIFISCWLSLHFMRGFDADFGAINLILSIEASTAGAVLMLVAEQSADMQRRNSADQAQMLAAVLAIAESQRDMLTDHAEVLRALRESDERILKALISGETHDMAR